MLTIGSKYGAIMIDPPWQFRVWSKDTGHGRSAESHYPTLDLDEMKKLPMSQLFADDCAVFMWSTFPTLPEALKLGAAWGLTYKTCAFTWIKRTVTGNAWFTGMGYWTRSNPEPCLLFTKGNPKRKSKGVMQLIVENGSQLPLFEIEETEAIVSPIMGHSTKPDEAYRRIEQLVNGDYLDVFARRNRKGWDAIGNEIDGQDIRDVLKIKGSFPE
jgi:N6-adenosine-specific RNA methylase IME4